MHNWLNQEFARATETMGIAKSTELMHCLAPTWIIFKLVQNIDSKRVLFSQPKVNCIIAY